MKPPLSLEDAVKLRPAGTQITPIELDKNTILLQIAIPSSYVAEDITQWTEILKTKLPKNVLICVTQRGVYMKAHRPKHYEIKFQNSTFDSPKLINQIKSSLIDEEHVTLTFKKCKFTHKE